MTRDQAKRRCAALNADNEFAGRRWIVQQHEADRWRVVAVSIPGVRAIKPLKPRSKPSLVLQSRPTLAQ